MLNINQINPEGAVQNQNKQAPKQKTILKQDKSEDFKKAAKLTGTLLVLASLGIAAIKMPKDKALRKINKALQKELSDSRLNGCAVSYCSAKDYIKAIKQTGLKPAKFLTVGGESVVLELNDGNILKLSPNRYNYNVDGACAPEISRGKVSIKSKNNNEKNVFYLVQNKVNVGGINKEELAALKQKVEAEGCILQDYKLEDGTIKQNNFGWYLNDNNERTSCILDTGTLKRTPERHFFEELIQAADKDKISESDFTNHMSNTLLINNIMQNMEKSSQGYYQEYNNIVNEFVELSITQNIRPLNALQKTLQAHGLPPIKEFKI